MKAYPNLIPNMPTTKETLAAMQAEHLRMQQENHEKYLQRKARTHRLCEHGATLEMVLPATEPMDRNELAAFLKSFSRSDT